MGFNWRDILCEAPITKWKLRLYIEVVYFVFAEKVLPLTKIGIDRIHKDSSVFFFAI